MYVFEETDIDNNIFNEILAEYYKKEPNDIKIELFLNRLSIIIPDFFVEKMETKEEIDEFRSLLYKQKIKLFSPYKDFFNKKERKRIEKLYQNIDELIKEYEKDILPNQKREQIKTIILETIIDASVQLQQNHQILNNLKNAPIENNRTGLLMIIINNQKQLQAEQRKIGNSATQKTIGNTDFVLLRNNKILTICEAINITKKMFPIAKIKEHVERIFFYDKNGLHYNFLILYIEQSENIQNILTKYSESIDNMDFKYKRIGNFNDISKKLSYLRESSIKVGVTKHKRNDEYLELFHILIFL